MKAATTFKEALEVLEKAEFRNGIAATQVGYYPDYVQVDVSSSTDRVATFRLAKKEMVEKVFWLDWIGRVGDGGSKSLQKQLELIEDILALAKAWEGTK